MLTLLPLTRERDEHDPAHGPLAWRPEPEWRQLVEIMVMLGCSQEAICREFATRNLPCTTVETLQRAFPDELRHGKERRILAYGVKMHTLAMSNSPQALPALRYLLSTQGGPQWRVTENRVVSGDPEAPALRVSIDQMSDDDIQHELDDIRERRRIAAGARAMAENLPKRSNGVGH